MLDRLVSIVLPEGVSLTPPGNRLRTAAAMGEKRVELASDARFPASVGLKIASRDIAQGEASNDGSTEQGSRR